MIKFNNSIRTIVTAVILPVIFSSCIREEMTCGNQIVVQRIGEDGGAVTRGTASLPYPIWRINYSAFQLP